MWKIIFRQKVRRFPGYSKEEIRCLLNLATKELLFIFNNDYFSQIDGVAIGSPLVPTLANTFSVTIVGLYSMSSVIFPSTVKKVGNITLTQICNCY